jgi:hypothetical protein
MVVLVPALVAAAALPAAAQRNDRGACRVDSGAAWAVKQRAWLNEVGNAWSNDTLRTRLLAAAGLQPGALAIQAGHELETMPPGLAAGDGASIAELRTLASTRGSTWPTKSVVGAAGVRAVWLLAHRDTALARAALKRMMEAGPEESHAADVATLEDRVRLQSGRKQLYGTQFRTGPGGIMLAPMEDSAHVDLRREDAGLPPFAVSACLVRKGGNGA